MKAGIAIDDWKLPIFTRHLTQSGYTFVNKGALTDGSLLLQVDTENPRALHGVIMAADDEAMKTGKPS